MAEQRAAAYSNLAEFVVSNNRDESDVIAAGEKITTSINCESNQI
ncbi:MAG: hypothetical protein OXG88_00595 [Gammaproteobacteria bacterium]|nr:hypothetical protein [Gammaproteobacteria bacterium]